MSDKPNYFLQSHWFISLHEEANPPLVPSGLTQSSLLVQWFKGYCELLTLGC